MASIWTPHLRGLKYKCVWRNGDSFLRQLTIYDSRHWVINYELLLGDKVSHATRLSTSGIKLTKSHYSDVVISAMTSQRFHLMTSSCYTEIHRRATFLSVQCLRFVLLLSDSNIDYGPLARYVKSRVTHVPWCIPGSLTSAFLWSRRRGKRSRHSRRMRYPQFYVSSKRLMSNDVMSPGDSITDDIDIQGRSQQ